MSDGSCRFSVKQERAGLTSSPMIDDLNSIANTVNSAYFGFTSSPTLNNRDYQYNHVITTRAWSEVAQLLLPMNQSRRLAFRTVSYDAGKVSASTTFREIPYTDEVPLLNSDGTISVTSRQTQELLTTDLGDMRGSTVGEIKEAINKVFNLSQGGIMVISLLMNVSDFLTHIGSDSYTTRNVGTKYTIILSGNHKYQKGYALGEIKDMSSMQSYFFRINNGYYEYLGESVTMRDVEEAIENAFERRRL